MCDEILFEGEAAAHRCPPAWLAADAADGPWDPAEATTIHAADAEEAAERLAELRRELDVPWRVYVVRGPAGRGWHGWAAVDREAGLAEVRISDRAGPASALATLAHEWAHLLAWAEGADEPDHGPRWRELHAEARWALGLDR